VSIVAAVVIAAGTTTVSNSPTPTPIDAIGADIADAFTGYNLFFFGGAVAGTGIMAFSGADHAIRVGVQQSLAAPAYAETSFYAGYVVPAIVAPTVWIVGLATRDREVTGAGSAAVQALAVTLVTVTVLKVGVGRVYPLNGGDPNAPDRLQHPEYAHELRPFQSIDAAWPSGHTAATMSIAAALTAYYPDRLWIPFVGYPLALAIGFGVIDRDSHWASDVLAGGLIGHAIGYSIGRAFRRRAHGESEQQGVELVPLVGGRMQGIGIGATW
jgi:membrane-associated phospholipid phosphatase